MMFYKVVYHNSRERKREVFLMSVFEEQVTKWDNCLDPSDNIKAYDRTYNLIKDRLLKAVLERSRANQDASAAIIDIDDRALDDWNDDEDED